MTGCKEVCWEVWESVLEVRREMWGCGEGKGGWGVKKCGGGVGECMG